MRTMYPEGVYSCAIRGGLLRSFAEKGVDSCALGGGLLRHRARIIDKPSVYSL